MSTKHKTSHGICRLYTNNDCFIGEFTKKLLTLEQNKNFAVKYLLGDNASKNESFLKEINSKKWYMGVTPEWTPRATT